MYRRIAIAALAAITTLTIAACGGNDDATSSSTTPASPTSTTAESADNGPVVDRITGALDKLDAPWGNVQYKGENEEAVATDVWHLDINNRSASILVFRDEEARKDWELAVLWVDGVSVAYDNVGISLNSKLGLEDSLELAPKLAEELDGRVTTGDTDLFRDEDEWAEETEDGSDPTSVSAPEPESIWAPTGQGYQCPMTDAFVWDPDNCTPENLGAGTVTPYSGDSAYGNESGVDWQEKNTNSDWSDAEVDAYIACFEKYDYSDVASEVC